MFEILLISAKLATLGPPEMNVFRNNDYDVIILIRYVNKKSLSRDPNYIVYMVMWPNFGNSNISIREVIKTSKL